MKKILLYFLAILVFFSSFTMTASAYDGAAAAKYAKLYATKYNSSCYPSFSGGDCTNFASQCVRAGGLTLSKIPDSKISYSSLNNVFKTESYWDCREHSRTCGLIVKNDYVWTSTWSVVSKEDNGFWGFFPYMTKHRGATSKDYSVNTESKLNEFLKKCEVGDVLQIRSPGSQYKYHSVIVTEKTKDKKNKRWDIKIAYHSSDTAPVDFRTGKWEAFGKNSIWTIISFKNAK